MPWCARARINSKETTKLQIFLMHNPLLKVVRKLDSDYQPFGNASQVR